VSTISDNSGIEESRQFAEGLAGWVLYCHGCPAEMQPGDTATVTELDGEYVSALCETCEPW